MGNKITFAMLERANACGEKWEFEKLFGNEVEVTEEVAKKYLDRFSVDFIVSSYFPQKLRQQWSNDLNEIAQMYYAETRRLRALYLTKKPEQTRSYYGCGPECDVCFPIDEGTTMEQRRKYQAARNEARKTYDDLKAELFAKLYNSLPADITHVTPNFY
jgi:hypothetical protein